MDEVTLGQVFVRVFRDLHLSLIPPILHIWTVGESYLPSWHETSFRSRHVILVPKNENINKMFVFFKDQSPHEVSVHAFNYISVVSTSQVRTTVILILLILYNLTGRLHTPHESHVMYEYRL
jgi:hypothetical protein